MFYKIQFENRSPYRYVAYFRGDKDSYFSVEVQVAQRKWGSLLEDGNQYSIEVCKIEAPQIMAYYTLKESFYTVSGEQFITDIGKILVKYNALPASVPFEVEIEDHQEKKHSFIQMNGGTKYAIEDLNYNVVRNLYKDFSNVNVLNNDEIEEDWHCFSKGTDRIEILKWFDESFIYPLNSLTA